MIRINKCLVIFAEGEIRSSYSISGLWNMPEGSLTRTMIPIDLDDGVKVNYAKFADVLARIK